jgi:hypothetical protein
MTDSADICRSLSVLSALSAAFETFSSGRRPLPYPLIAPEPISKPWSQASAVQDPRKPPNPSSRIPRG